MTRTQAKTPINTESNPPTTPVRVRAVNVGGNRTGTTKLTPESAARFVDLLRAGQHRETACHAVGFSARAMRDWIKCGEQGDERWSDFAHDVREAEAGCEIPVVARILELGQNDWRALMEYLKLRFPLRWGDAKAASARVDAEREAILDAMQKALNSRGLGNAVEEILRDIAGLGDDEAANTVVESRAEH